MKLFLSALLVLYCFMFATAAPIWDDDFDFSLSLPNIEVDCRQLGCPDNANSCSRKIETIDDRRKIKTTVVCSNNNGQVLKNDTTTSANPNPGSIVNGYEFFGSFSGGNQVITNNNDQVENFNKK